MAHPTLVVTVWVALAAVLVVVRTRTGRAQLLHGTARRSELRLPPGERAEVVARRLGHRTTAGALGMSLALLGPALLLPGDLVVGRLELGVPLLLGAGFLGAAVGTAAHTLLLARRPATAGPRVARPRDVSLADYVSPLERWSTVVAVSLAPVLAAVALLVPRVPGASEPDLGLVLTAAVLPPLALAAALVVCRLVLALPQPATSSLELAWDDALRSQSLRDVLTVPLYAGLMGTVLLAAHTAMSLPDRLASLAVPVVVLGAMLLLGLLLVVTLASRPWRHARRRLWPDSTPAPHAAGADGVLPAGARATGTPATGASPAGGTDRP